MNREERKQAVDARNQESLAEGINILSEEAMQKAFEDMNRSSEKRFEVVRSPKAIKSFAQATEAFRISHKLVVRVIDAVNQIPLIARDCIFKYSRPGYSVLQNCSRRMSKGEKIKIVSVYENNLLIGYGIAVILKTKCDIEIIDVDSYSRRESGLKKTLELSKKRFEVGVAHVVVEALIEACPRPIKVDATTPSSRYVFKSLGFTHDETTANPCILRME